MDIKIPIVLIAIILLGVGGFFMSQDFSKSSISQPDDTGDLSIEETTPAGEQPASTGEEESTPAPTPAEEETTPEAEESQGEEETTPAEEEEEQLPQPPTGTVSIYKGFWMPVVFMLESSQSMYSVSALKDVGANIILFGPTVEINTEGEIFLGNPYSSLSLFESRLAQLAERYYPSGIRMGLVIETMYVENFGQAVPPGGPPPFPSGAADIPGFFDKYNVLVGQIAKLAEKYQLEIFSPMNEPDLKLGVAGAAKWAQEILPTVKANYSGKILFKNAFASVETSQIDFSGYDIIGCDPTPGGGPDSLTQYSTDLKDIISRMQSWAQRDNVAEIMFTEFGAWGGALSFTEEQKMLAHRIVFEEGQGKVQGFFVLDPPPDLDRGLTGTQTLAEIKTWFKETL